MVAGSAAWPLTPSPRLPASCRLIISYSCSNSCRHSNSTFHIPCLAPRTAAGGYCPRVNRVSEAVERRRQLEAEGNKPDQRSCCYPRASQCCPSGETLCVCCAHSVPRDAGDCLCMGLGGAAPAPGPPALWGGNREPRWCGREGRSLHHPSAQRKGRHCHHPAGDVPSNRELRNAKQNKPAEAGSLQNTFTQFCVLSFRFLK